jgi:glycosyltransferase involved in cell wall biosynthesis
VLFLAHELPWPLDGGWKLRTFQSLAALAETCDIALAAFVDPDLGPTALVELRNRVPQVREAVALPRHIRIRSRPFLLGRSFIAAAVTGLPYSVAKFRDERMKEAIASLVHQFAPHLIYICNLPMASYLGKRPHSLPYVVEAHNVEHLIWDDYVPRAPRILRPLLHAERRALHQYELAVWRSARGIVAICDEDAAIIRTMMPSRPPVTVVPPTIPFDPGPARSIASTPAIGMLGTWSWPPNRISLRWFADAILPRLRDLEPGIAVHIGGRGIPPGLGERLRGEGCTLLGYVDSLEAYYRDITVVAAPYLSGGGVRIKVLEAMARALPLVTTAMGARGLPAEDGLNCFLRETPEDFAQALVRLVKDRPLAESLGHSARMAFEARHSEVAAASELRKSVLGT